MTSSSTEDDPAASPYASLGRSNDQDARPPDRVRRIGSDLAHKIGNITSDVDDISRRVFGVSPRVVITSAQDAQSGYGISPLIALVSTGASGMRLRSGARWTEIRARALRTRLAGPQAAGMLLTAIRSARRRGGRERAVADAARPRCGTLVRGIATRLGDCAPAARARANCAEPRSHAAEIAPVRPRGAR